MSFWRIALALLCSAISFPAMLFERLLPQWPAPGLLETEGSFFHKAKNVTTECFRRDAQWWSKASAFAVLVLLLTHLL
jgi:hypothetical protein